MRTAIIIFSIILLGFAVYGANMHNGFLMDDVHVVVDNPLIRSLSHLPSYFSQPFLKTYYRPVTQLSLAWDYHIWGLNPFGYRLTALLLHITNAGLIVILLYLLWDNIVLASLTGILFVIHPIGTIAVNYIADRSNLLSAFFILSALVFFLQALKKSKNVLYFLGCFCFLLALLSHESAVSFPLYLAWLIFAVPNNPDTRKRVLFIIPVVLIGLVYLFVRIKLLHLQSVLPDMGSLLSWEAARDFIAMICRYITLAVLPGDIYLIYTIRPEVLTILVAALFIVTAVFKSGGRQDPRGWGLFWFACGMPLLYYLMFSRPEMGLIMQDNWAYLPVVGLLIVISYWFTQIRKSINIKIWLVLVLACIGAYASVSIVNSVLWSNEYIYCRYWLAGVPKNPYALNSLGVFYGERGDYDKAKEYFEKGIDCFRIEKDGVLTNELHRGYLLTILYNNLAYLSRKQGQLDQAVKYHNNAVMLEQQGISQ